MNGMRKIVQISRKTKEVEENESDELDFDQELEEVVDKASNEDVSSSKNETENLHNRNSTFPNKNISHEVEVSEDNNYNVNKNNDEDLLNKNVEVVREIIGFVDTNNDSNKLPFIISQDILLNIPGVCDLSQLDDELSDCKSRESKESENDRSIYVKNLEFNTTPEDLENHFKKCGEINRITILVDKYTGLPKGYAFIEFSSLEAIDQAYNLNDTILKGKSIKVEEKRKNLPTYFGKKNKFFKRPTFTNEQYIKSSNSFFGPLKGRYVSNRNFQPY